MMSLDKVNSRTGKIRMGLVMQKKQQGVALIMALIMLLVITVLGVSSVRMSAIDTQISGNGMYSSMVFQGAESALGKVVTEADWKNISLAASSRGVIEDIPDDYFNPVETVTGGATLDSSATITFEGVTDAPPLDGMANSTGKTGFTYQIFRISAQSKLATTSASDTHIEGRAIHMPK